MGSMSADPQRVAGSYEPHAQWSKPLRESRTLRLLLPAAPAGAIAALDSVYASRREQDDAATLPFPAPSVTPSAAAMSFCFHPCFCSSQAHPSPFAPRVGRYRLFVPTSLSRLFAFFLSVSLLRSITATRDFDGALPGWLATPVCAERAGAPQCASHFWLRSAQEVHAASFTGCSLIVQHPTGATHPVD